MIVGEGEAIMMAEERHERIASALAQQGFMSIGDITSHAGCSVATARRGLDALARIGRIRRSRGGAAASGNTATAVIHTPPTVRAARDDAEPAPFAAVKRRIARTAALVADGDTAGLAGDTTTLEVARCLRGRSLGLVTNAIDIARELAAIPGARVVLIVGVLNAGLDELVGPLAEGMLARVRVDTLFISVDGSVDSLSAEAGATIIGDLEEPIVRAFAARAPHHHRGRSPQDRAYGGHPGAAHRGGSRAGDGRRPVTRARGHRAGGGAGGCCVIVWGLRLKSHGRSVHHHNNRSHPR